jgi:hypothetical protein
MRDLAIFLKQRHAQTGDIDDIGVVPVNTPMGHHLLSLRLVTNASKSNVIATS